MGSYATINGTEFKLIGLLARAVVEAAEKQPDLYPGVTLEDGLISGGTTELSVDNVDSILTIMRLYILNGWAHQCNIWSNSFGEARPISHIQDIMRYATDVQTFEALALWRSEIGRKDEDTICFG